MLAEKSKMPYNTHGDYMATKTNAIRLVEAAGFDCKEASYAYDESDLNGRHAAIAIGLPEEQVFKTLVTCGDKNGINVFCIPVCYELDLKKAARVSNNKKVDMLPQKDLLQITGYIRGGCSPLGMKKKYPTYIDRTCCLFPIISVSAGKRGQQMLVPHEAILELVNAELADIIQE